MFMYHVEDDLRYARNCLKKESFFVNFFVFLFLSKQFKCMEFHVMLKQLLFPSLVSTPHD